MGRVVAGRDDAQGLLSDAEGHGDARPDTVSREERRDGESLAREVGDLDASPMEKRLAGERFGRRHRRDADRSRLPSEPRVEPEPVGLRIVPEDSHTVRVEEQLGHARRVPEDPRFVGGFQEALAKVL